MFIKILCNICIGISGILALILIGIGVLSIGDSDGSVGYFFFGLLFILNTIALASK